MSVRGGLFDFCGRVGDLEKEHPAGTLVPKNIHAHYHCQKKTNSRTFSEPKKKHVIRQNITHTDLPRKKSSPWKGKKTRACTKSPTLSPSEVKWFTPNTQPTIKRRHRSWKRREWQSPYQLHCIAGIECCWPIRTDWWRFSFSKVMHQGFFDMAFFSPGQ